MWRRPPTPPFAQRDARTVVRLIVRPPGAADARWEASSSSPSFQYTHHALITDRDGEMLALEADHRCHAVVENANRDPKDGMALDHLPSGRFGANGAWLGFNVIAHNLVRWLSRIGLQETLVTTTTLRTRHVAIPGWVVRHARQLHLHLPARWPWAQQFLAGLERLRSLPVAVSTPAQPHAAA
jgi:Transposase DDE domain group 1